MAQPTNTFDTYDAKGIREDLQDSIYNVSPETTPVLSAGRRFKATQTYHEWQRDTLDTPSATNAVIEGDDRTGQAVTPTQRVGNYTQLMDKVVVTSTRAESSRKAGRASERQYQKAKKMKELKRDIEARLLSNNEAVAGNGSTVARETGGLGVMLYTNADHNGAGATATHSSGAPTTAITAGTNRAFTEALLKTAQQNVFNTSGEMPNMLCLTPSHKTTFSAFTGIAEIRKSVDKGKQAQIVGGADVYMGDFGEIYVTPNYVHGVANPNTAFLLNPDTYGVAYAQNFKSEELAKTGHAHTDLVSVEVAAVVTSETANAKIADLTA